jgi:hypothetical protein
MDGPSLHRVLSQAATDKRWVEVHAQGCSTFMILPTSVEVELNIVVVEGRVPASRLPVDPPSVKDLQSGEVMRQRLKSTSEHTGCLYLDPQDIKAVLVHNP